MVLTRGGASTGSRHTTKLRKNPKQKTAAPPPSSPIQVNDDDIEYYLDQYGNYTLDTPTHPTPPSSTPRDTARNPRVPAPPPSPSRTVTPAPPESSRRPSPPRVPHTISTSFGDDTVSDPTFKEVSPEEEEESDEDSEEIPLRHMKLKGKVGEKRKQGPSPRPEAELETEPNASADSEPRKVKKRAGRYSLPRTSVTHRIPITCNFTPSADHIFGVNSRGVRFRFAGDEEEDAPTARHQTNDISPGPAGGAAEEDFPRTGGEEVTLSSLMRKLEEQSGLYKSMLEAQNEMLRKLLEEQQHTNALNLALINKLFGVPPPPPRP